MNDKCFCISFTSDVYFKISSFHNFFSFNFFFLSLHFNHSVRNSKQILTTSSRLEHKSRRETKKLRECWVTFILSYKIYRLTLTKRLLFLFCILFLINFLSACWLSIFKNVCSWIFLILFVEFIDFSITVFVSVLLIFFSIMIIYFFANIHYIFFLIKRFVFF